MNVICAAFNVHDYYDDVKFRLPLHNTTERSAWLNEIQKHQNIRAWTDHMLVCDLHFHKDEIIKGCRTKVATGAVPTIFQ